MRFRRRDFTKMMEAVLKRARAYFEDEVGATFIQTDRTVGGIDLLELRSVTVIVGTGGPVDSLIAFCFDPHLLDRLYLVSTASLGIAPHERALYLRETAAETVNVILGHATADLAAEGNDMTLSSPVVLEEGRRIHRPRNAIFTTLKVLTNIGVLDIYFIAPSEMFDQELNVLPREGEHASIESPDRR